MELQSLALKNAIWRYQSSLQNVKKFVFMLRTYSLGLDKQRREKIQAIKPIKYTVINKKNLLITLYTPLNDRQR